MSFGFRDIIWVVIITLVVIFLSKCHQDNTSGQDMNIKRLQDKAHNDSIVFANQITQYEAKAANAHDTAATYINKNKAVEQQLDQRSATVLRLAAALRAANIPDTNVIGVGQEYLDYCDSLAFESSTLAINFNNYRQNNAFVLAAKAAEINAKDTVINLERNAKLACKDDYNALMHYYQESQKVKKVRNQVYIGAELLGSEQLLIQNVGIALSLKTKTNKLWQVSGGLQNGGGWYGRINGNILIRLHKN